MITHARQILHAASADEPYRVHLQIVPTPDVGSDFNSLGSRTLATFAMPSLAFGRRRVDAGTNTALCVTFL